MSRNIDPARRRLSTIIVIAGGIVIAAGAGLIYLPAGLLVGGILMILLGLVGIEVGG